MADPAIDAAPVLTYAPRAPRPVGLFPRICLVILCIYPFLPVAALHLAWIVAWIVLGHMPRSSLDDPNGIRGAFDVPYRITGLLLVSMPWGMLLGLLMGLWLTAWWINRRRYGIQTSMLMIAALLGIYAFGYILLKVDPLGVLYWYMD